MLNSDKTKIVLVLFAGVVFGAHRAYAREADSRIEYAFELSLSIVDSGVGTAANSNERLDSGETARLMIRLVSHTAAPLEHALLESKIEGGQIKNRQFEIPELRADGDKIFKTFIRIPLKIKSDIWLYYRLRDAQGRILWGPAKYRLINGLFRLESISTNVQSNPIRSPKRPGITDHKGDEPWRQYIEFRRQKELEIEKYQSRDVLGSVLVGGGVSLAIVGAVVATLQAIDNGGVGVAVGVVAALPVIGSGIYLKVNARNKISTIREEINSHRSSRSQGRQFRISFSKNFGY